MKLTEKYRDRHPSTVQILRWLEPNENLPEPGLTISRRCAGLADDVTGQLTDGPELTAGLRKLVEAKDCLVRQSLP